MAGAQSSGLSSGDLLSLLSATSFAVWTLAVGISVMRTRRPILMTVAQLAVCGVLCLVTGAAGGAFQHPGRWPPPCPSFCSWTSCRRASPAF